MSDEIQKDIEVPFSFKVTKKHLERGTERCPHTCALALALKDAGCKYIAVGYDFTCFTYKGHPYKMNLNNKVKTALHKFDRGSDLEPFVVKGIPETIFD